MPRLILLLLITIWTFIGIIILNHQDMRLYAAPKISHDPSDFKPCKAVLVLGAGRNYTFARPNFSFIGRVDAAVLYIRRHPDDQLVLSGYSDRNLYNEPFDMLQALQRNGVLINHYTIDYKSIDTYSSIVRFKEQFGSGPVVLISEPEHLRRAIWMASWLGVEAYGFSAKGYPGGTPRWFRIREYLASVKARLRVMGILSNTES